MPINMGKRVVMPINMDFPHQILFLHWPHKTRNQKRNTGCLERLPNLAICMRDVGKYEPHYTEPSLMFHFAFPNVSHAKSPHCNRRFPRKIFKDEVSFLRLEASHQWTSISKLICVHVSHSNPSTWRGARLTPHGNRSRKIHVSSLE